MNDRHVSDDRLIDICVTRSATPAEEVHVAVCVQCEKRRDEIVAILRELDEAATHEAEAAFPPARLERQHATILRRVERDHRPGELVTFPAGQVAARLLVRSRPRIRWAAAAAAAAFVAGVLTGNLTHDFTVRKAAERARVVSEETDTVPLHAVSTTFSEDEFLGEIELATSNSGPAALRPLDAMTPRVR